MKSMKNYLHLGGAVLGLALLFPACSKKERHSAGGESLPAVSVALQAVEARPHVASEEVAGSVRARLQAAITPEATARIEKMLVAPGQRVKQGEALLQLDPRDAQAKLDQARAVCEQTGKSLQRYSALVASKAASQADYDAAVANHRVAQAALAQAETALGHTTIVAPFDGVITRKLADVGDLASPWKTVLEMEDPAALRFEADVPEAIIGSVRDGAALPVRVGTVNVSGTVKEIAPVADVQSRTFLVKLDLPQAPGLRTGQFGRAEVPVSETTVLRAASGAVIRRGQMEIAFVLDGAHARLRLVKTGKNFGGEVEIVSGLEAGEKVVVENAARLADGQPVEVKTK